jgi:hypothetical protein
MTFGWEMQELDLPTAHQSQFRDLHDYRQVAFGQPVAELTKFRPAESLDAHQAASRPARAEKDEPKGTSVTGLIASNPASP